MSDETKTCPDCAETIKAAANLCRFCQYDFVAGVGGPKAKAPAPQTGSKGLHPVIIILIVLFGGFLVIGVLAAIMLPAIVKATQRAKVTACAGNLKQLWAMEYTYMTQFGGRLKSMPNQTGSEFWLELSRTVPPIVDPAMTEVYQCPLLQDHGACDYRGPAFPVTRLGSGDAVGADKLGNHRGQGGNVLRKTGDVVELSQQDFERLPPTLKP